MSDFKISTFTTRIDTIYGVTFVVLAPEHPLVLKITKADQLGEVNDYIQKTKNLSDRERQISKEKTGVFTGSYVKHPLTGENIPVWIADYVLYGYGTGAIMAVPGHDERDYQFAKKYNLPIKKVVQNVAEGQQDECFLEEGISINSPFTNGLTTLQAKEKLSSHIINSGLGHKKVNYKFRDWVFSRQRYWGEPFPFIYKKAD